MFLLVIKKTLMRKPNKTNLKKENLLTHVTEKYSGSVGFR